ncbi:MAG: 16S rRNA (guanine(966)-N(2))-methyltransferase RsmD [Firmicutes bacterium]|nr:16S rRNA (guanine(966)-N(2))-methyltransferase RsmD [Bacillota bacterium]
MRIIAGTLKGRKLKSPRTDDIRPTSDKVKEAVFSMLIPYIYEGFTAMDVFSGTGNLGLEAISRGAGTVFFSDSSRESMSLIKENIKTCGVLDKAVLLSGDYQSNIRRVREKVDIFFLDPPYANGYLLPAIRAIEEAGNISVDGIIVCEHEHREILPEQIGSFTVIKERRYGKTSVTIYQKGQSDNV